MERRRPTSDRRCRAGPSDLLLTRPRRRKRRMTTQDMNCLRMRRFRGDKSDRPRSARTVVRRTFGPLIGQSIGTSIGTVGPVAAVQGTRPIEPPPRFSVGARKATNCREIPANRRIDPSGSRGQIPANSLTSTSIRATKRPSVPNATLGRMPLAGWLEGPDSELVVHGEPLAAPGSSAASAGARSKSVWRMRTRARIAPLKAITAATSEIASKPAMKAPSAAAAACGPLSAATSLRCPRRRGRRHLRGYCRGSR
jgi:hypothetical protein